MFAEMVSCGLTRGFSSASAKVAATSESEVRRMRRKCFMAETCDGAGVSATTKMKTILLLLLSGPAILTAHASSLSRETRLWRLNHEREVLAEFVELLSIPNLASDTPNIR